jgi:adenylate cyclase
MTMEGFKRKLTTIFSADVAGYSRLMGEDEAATVKALTAYREIMAGLIKQHRGRVVDSPGDNVLAEFGSVVDAVQCAVAVQKEFQARNAELPENRKMEFRIGINLGDVIEEGDRIYGDGVNIAARLQSLADPGGICISKTAFDHIETKLPLGYEYLGEQTVKNIAKPVGAYKVLMEPRVVVAGEKEKRLPVRSWRRKTILAGALAVLVVIVGLLVWNFSVRAPRIEPASVDRMAFPLPEKPSIAVLPFVNMSGDPQQEYFSDGITEQIITGLSKIPQLFVIARNSTFTYKGKPVKVQKVAEDLGVRYVLEGSVQRSGDRTRITAQLVDAIKGHHLWAESYDRHLKDIFVLQDEITLKIMTAMRVKLTHGGQTRLYERFSTDNIQALDKGMQGVHVMRRLAKQDNAQARQFFEEAIALDPHYVAAHTLLAMTHLYDVWLGWSTNPRQSMAQAIKLGERALAMADDFDMAHSLFGHIYLVRRQYEKAVAEGERAVDLNPNSADAHARLAMSLTYAGRPEEAVALFKKAIRFNPLPPDWYFLNLGNAYRHARLYEEAIAAYKKILHRNPDLLFAHMGLASVYSLLGREGEARAAAKEVLRINPKFSLKGVEKTMLYKNKSHVEVLIDALRKAGLN